MRKTWIETDCGILCAASAVGMMERNGPLGACFDLHSEDDRFGQDTWEKAEAEMSISTLSKRFLRIKYA